MSNASSCKYAHMSDEEFVRFAGGMVGWDLYKEALLRLERRLHDDVDHDRYVEDLESDHAAEICRLESRIEDLESELEHA